MKNADAFKKMSSSIDKTADTNENIVLQSMHVSFENGAVVTDRDGTPIKTADFVGGKTLIPASMTINQATPESTIVSTNSVAYKRILTPASNYKAFYANEQPPAEPPLLFVSGEAALAAISAKLRNRVRLKNIFASIFGGLR